jgi:hypothetical protein
MAAVDTFSLSRLHSLFSLDAIDVPFQQDLGLVYHLANARDVVTFLLLGRLVLPFAITVNGQRPLPIEKIGLLIRPLLEPCLAGLAHMPVGKHRAQRKVDQRRGYCGVQPSDVAKVGSA